MLQPEWWEVDSATAGLATATRAAPGARKKLIGMTVLASYSDPAESGTLTISWDDEAGTTITVVYYIHGADQLVLDIRPGSNEAISAALEAGGAGVVGQVAMCGRTE